jgi:uncharacterized protein
VDNGYTLYQLQEIDSTWEKVRRRIIQLQNAAGGSVELKTAREETAAVESELHQWIGSQLDADLEARSLEGKISESEQRLMGGEVRNPKELESLQASVESMRRHKTMVDDRNVEAMLKIEELTDTLDTKKSSLSTLEAEWQDKQQSVEAELLQRKREFVYLKRLREQTVERLDPAILEQYEHLRKRKNGVAITKVEDTICSACHIQVPTGLLSDVRRENTLTLCPGCGRILYAP